MADNTNEHEHESTHEPWGHDFWSNAHRHAERMHRHAERDIRHQQQQRERWQGHGRGRGGGRGRQDWFGAEGGWPWGGPGGPGGFSGFGGFGPFGPGRERLERGLLKYVILSVLKDGPKHGYDIIKYLEEKTGGHYTPSPGTLYPTLQLLEDQGLVRSEQEGEKRVYSLTEAGHAELDKQHNAVEGFWTRFRERIPSGANMYELKFAGDAFKDLLRTVGGGLRSGAFAQNPETVRKIRQALERCQNEIREILTGSAAGKEADSTETSETNTEEYV